MKNLTKYILFESLIGKISEIDNDISWGCLDVKVLPDEQKFRSMSKDGYLWISPNYIK